MFDLIRYLPYMYRIYVPWLDHAIAIKYEGLINNPEEELETLAKLLPEPLDYLVARSKMRAGPTFRKGVVGEGRRLFLPRHEKVFDENWGEIMEKLGYE